MRELLFAWRMMVRDWRAGELTILGVAMLLAVTALTSVAFLSDRVQLALVQQSHQLLGGDLLLSADHPWDDAFRKEAHRFGLQLAESASFPSMVSAGDLTQLAEVKAVTDNFPLRGRLRIAPALESPDAETDHVPARGECWPDERLARVASAQTLMLGELELKTTAVLTLDPERGINAFALAPRLMIHWADLPASGLVQPGARITWRLHLAGEKSALNAYRDWASGHLSPGERLESLDNARPELRNLFERAGRFLRLAALLTVVLAAIGVGLAADRYLRRHLDGCAVMRCMGATSKQILRTHVTQFILFGVLTVVLGTIAGYLVQALLQSLLAGFLSNDLPSASWQPWLAGAMVAVTLMLGFVVPPLLRLRNVPTVRVLRRDWTHTAGTQASAYVVGAVALAALMIWLAGEWMLGALVVLGFVMVMTVYIGLARLLLSIVVPHRGTRLSFWYVAWVNLRRHWRVTVVQAIALGLGLTTLLILTVMRNDLMDSWRSRIPADAPNRFVINVQPDQLAGFEDEFSRIGLPPPKIEPMVRGRLVAVNGQAKEAGDYADQRAQRLIDREFNLSWGTVLPEGNTIVSGQWFGDDATPQFSVEEGLAETLGLKVGDQLTYMIAGQSLSAKITSLRKLDWDSMRVNFFVIMPPAALNQYPASYITSFHLPAGRSSFISELVKAYPNITVVDVAALIHQLQNSLDQIVRAVQALFALALAAGLVVMLAALQSNADERQRELAIMRALGARRRQLYQAVLAEFTLLGGMAGQLAGGGAALLGWGLGHFVFHLPYVPGIGLPLSGILLGVLITVPAGLWATRTAIGRPVSVQLLAG